MQCQTSGQVRNGTGAVRTRTHKGKTPASSLPRPPLALSFPLKKKNTHNINRWTRLTHGIRASCFVLNEYLMTFVVWLDWTRRGEEEREG